MVVSTVNASRRASGAVVMQDVARAAGVSQKTVSRVVNDSPQVRPEVRERVLAAIGALGYRRNSAARALAAGRTHVIGIVAMGSSLFGVAQHVMGVERAARARGYGTVVVSTGEDEDDSAVAPAVERALALGAEGVIVVEPLMRHAEEFDALADVPLVVPSQVGATHPRHSVVTAAEEEGARLATDHLLDLGHRTAVHISGPASWRPAVLRERGWRGVLEDRGAEVAAPVAGDWSARSGYRAAQELLARGPFTALFAANDSMAVGAVRALHEAGLRIPDDVAVIGFDDLPESEFQVVPLSSVRQDFAEIARLSVERIVLTVEDDPLPDRSSTVPAQLVPRASTALMTPPQT